MKRVRGESSDIINLELVEEVPQESPWTLLVHDVLHCIDVFLDPLSQVLFSLINKKNYERLKPSPFNMEAVLFVYGTLELIQKYDLTKCEDQGIPASCAAARGDLNLLKWLHEKHFCLNGYTLDCAARWGHLHIMQWMKEIGNLPWSKQTMQQAVQFGSVENLQWMVDNGCPEPHIQTYCAIDNGHLEVVKWLYDRNHEMCDRDIARAIEKGYPEIAAWLESTRQQFIIDAFVRGLFCS